MRAERAALGAAVAAGIAARVYVALARPLWADEIFTLTLARKSVEGILAALRADSGPPLHYLAAHALLLPFPAPGRGDLVVRLFSVACSLLHLPLLARVGTRLGRPRDGALSVILYALFPLAVLYGAEGRGYALASLLALVAFERALALRERPSRRNAAAVALAGAGAALTHYLAAFPVAALALLVPGTRPGPRRLLAAGLAGAALLFAPWVPVALEQPGASMAWSRAAVFRDAAIAFPANLAFGVEPAGSLLVPLAALGAIVVLGLLLRERRGVLSPLAAVLAGSLVFLALAQAATGALLLPGRTAVVFLPYVALLLASAPPAVPAVAALTGLAFLAHTLPTLAGPSPGEMLARLLEAPARSGRTIVAAGGYWGPELAYRLARAGVPGHVVLFPSAAAAHPGWYDEAELQDAALAREADALLAAPERPTVFVLPRGSRASAALAARLGPARRLLASPLLDVVETRPAAPR